MKKLLSILLSITLGVTSVFFISLDAPTFAAVKKSSEPPCCSGPEIEPVEIIGIEDEQSSQKRYLLETSELSPSEQLSQMLVLSNRIRKALLDGQDRISIADRKIPMNSEFVRSIHYFCPYLDGDNISIRLYYIVGENNYNHIEITNQLSTSSTKTWVSTIDDKLKELRSIISKAGSDPADRALVLHDYMASHYYYDETYQSVYPSIMLTQGKGVCQSYAYLFQYLMATDGVECYTTMVHNDVLHHAWNIIKIGANYYHVDVTWDDVVPDYYGMARHKYFLVSDETLYGLSDRDPARAERNLKIDCNDSSYENRYFSNSQSPIVFIDDNRYYVDFDEGLSTCKADGSNRTVIDNLGKWYVMDSGSYYTNKYSGLYKHGDYLYYNTSTSIKSYNTETGEVSVVANPDVSSGIIYGSAGFGNELRYAIQPEPHLPYADKTICTLNLGESSEDTEEYPGELPEEKTEEPSGEIPEDTTEKPSDEKPAAPAYAKSYVSSLKLSGGKASITASWKKPSASARKNFKGYEVRYSLSKKMTSAKSKKVSNTASSCKLTKLKRKKTYYVQVRTYSTGKFSKWSTAKAVRTK